MTPLAHLLLAAAVLVACVSAAPASGTDLADIELEDPRDKLAPVGIAEKVENDLRTKPVDIPVEIIEDSRPAIKTNEVADDDEEIKRPSIDLRNPGPPQRQEHDTQNADYFPAAQEKLLTVRETILQTQNLLRQGIQGVGNDISNWLSTNEQVNTIQQNIQSLRDTFTNQIQKLNEGIKELAVPQALKTESIPDSLEIRQPDLKKVESSIQILENNFNKGVRALSEGVSIVAILRAEDGSTAAVGEPTPAPAQPTAPTTASPPPVLIQFISDFQNTVADSMKNISTMFNNGVGSLQNFWNPTQSTVTPGVLADSPAGTTPTGSPWPNWQLPTLSNIFNGLGQSEQANQPPGAAAPGFLSTGFQNIQIALQNNPIVTGITNGISNLVRPGASETNSGTAGNNTPKPNDEKQPETLTAVASAPAAPPAAAPAVTNDATAPVTVAAAPMGPIRQILSNSPVVQSIAGTVQRIQSSINNPEQPRDTEKNEDLATKGGFYGGNRPNASVIAWSNFVNTLVGTIGAVVNGSIGTVSVAVNSAINTLGTNIQGVLTTAVAG